MTQAAMTLTHGHPRPTWPAVAKVHSGTRIVGFEVCRNEERERESKEREREKNFREKEKNFREREMQ